MEEKKIALLVTAVSILLYICILISIPFRRKKLKENSGKLLLPLENSVPPKVVGIQVLSLLVMLCIPIRNFAPYIQAVLALAANLAALLAARESAGIGLAGIYENLIIFSTNVVKFGDIASLPTLAYEDDSETVGVDRTQLQIIRHDATFVVLPFPTEEKRAEAVETILKVRPELKVEN